MLVRSTAGCSSTMRRSASIARWCRIRRIAAGGLLSPAVTGAGRYCGGGTTMTVWLSIGAQSGCARQRLDDLVSNNAYSPGVAPGAALRPRLDEAVLWVHLLRLNERRGPLFWRVARTLATLLSGRIQVAAWRTREQTVDSPARFRVGLDGEAVELTTPLQFSSRPGASSPAPSRRGRWASRWLSPVNDWVRGQTRPMAFSVDHREASDRFDRSTGPLDQREATS